MNENWMILIKDGQIFQAGYNVVPTVQLDAVLPVREHVAKQFDKLEYVDGKLRVKKGETLMSEEEYKKYESENNERLEEEMGIAVPETELVEPE